MDDSNYLLSYENYVKQKYYDFYVKSKFELIELQKQKKNKRDHNRIKRLKEKGKENEQKNIFINISK